MKTFTKVNSVEIDKYYRITFSNNKTVFAKCCFISDRYPGVFVFNGTQPKYGRREAVQLLVTNNTTHSDNIVIPVQKAVFELITNQ